MQSTLTFSPVHSALETGVYKAIIKRISNDVVSGKKQCFFNDINDLIKEKTEEVRAIDMSNVHKLCRTYMIISGVLIVSFVIRLLRPSRPLKTTQSKQSARPEVVRRRYRFIDLLTNSKSLSRF
jgi:hypothetical protein